jgi:hypothetical protein
MDTIVHVTIVIAAIWGVLSALGALTRWVAKLLGYAIWALSAAVALSWTEAEEMYVLSRMAWSEEDRHRYDGPVEEAAYERLNKVAIRLIGHDPIDRFEARLSSN